MKTRVVLCLIVGWMVVYSGNVWGYTESVGNNFFGTNAGAVSQGNYNSFFGANAGSGIFGFNTGSNNSFLGYSAGNQATTGTYNSFLGSYAGYSNTAGNNNTFLGYGAGYFNTTGGSNSFIGLDAGFSNITGSNNSFLGSGAGNSNSSGSGNVFLGYQAGFSETGSNRLYIDNSSTTLPLIYGEFDTNIVRVNGSLGVGVSPLYPADISSGASESQLHFSLSGTDTGGWITSVLDNNFFLSSGAAYNAFLGGWVQKSPDGKAAIAGSGSTGYRVQTRTGCAVGTVCSTPVTRLMIDYSGNVGLGLTAPLYPLHLAGGAYSDGVSWINASSREYKHNIRDLTTEEALSAFQGLNPVAFTLKTGGGDQHVGFIAEEVPELVATKDRKGLSPMDIVAVLTKVVQEQQRAMEEQQRSVQEQQKTISTLREELNELKGKVR